MNLETPHLLDRFCRYVQIDTEAKEGSPTYPSSPGQLEIGKLLVNELLAMGITDAMQSEFGIVTGTIPATVSHAAPTIAWIAHVDTSPETTGKNVKPIVLKNYGGQEIVLPGNPDKVIRPTECPEILKCVGKTIIHTDGTTLLGSDDKGGVAVIMETAELLMRHREIPHGPIKVCFTCDEEIGHGVDHVDVPSLGAAAGYTLDGGGQGEIEGETFSADKATVTIQGINIHPSIGKGKMLNAVRLASLFVDRMPQRTYSPETTSDRQGFLHPYRIEGGVAQTTIHILLRDFITEKLEEQAEILREIARQIEREYPLAKVIIEIHSQYRNMADGMKDEPRAMQYAIDAMRRAGMEPHLGSIRGGTDGSQLTLKGLPTPNLSTGEHNIHSPLEWTCLEEMQMAVKTLVELAKRWAEG